MKIENEVTGEIVVRNASYIRVEIYLRGEKIDRFGIYLNNECIEDYLEHNTDKFLGVENTYEGYAQLVKDLGLEIPQRYIKHWIPSHNDNYFCIDSTGEVDEVYRFSCSDNKRIKNYNAFPTRDLCEKGANFSKLGRLILLWQYTNDCIFTPDWSSDDQAKYYVMYDNVDKKVSCDYNNNLQSYAVYFKTEEQARAFVKMYEKEIKKIMGVI